MSNLQHAFGNIDIYLFDQLLKGTFDNCPDILDAGCGGGRNIIYFLQNGFNIHGIDPNAEAIEQVKQMAAILAPTLPADNFKVAAAEALPYEDNIFDLVISSAVLHFANDHNHFDAMLRSMWRVIKPGGYLFARLASTIGIADKVQELGNGRYVLPDGSQRYLVDEGMLMEYTVDLGGELFEPIKTTNVQGLRCMTTWCLRKTGNKQQPSPAKKPSKTLF
ncbi:class I SAM-dependent methyltransferase [Mucilaginibacter sp. 21P]|uniref:class I SAM-dependent methyltransferase n=1 Tax=Mucilaginibacter sp. 21P TaxID=2778902 RepID=UPI001C59AA94|nr:class I SAM-dependent methyltransferase [Mucilaginibacter sp. 21P]QXV65292.1 class I SAM-dependent methyltransferase [Mucilaginibacter sp. 21P]